MPRWAVTGQGRFITFEGGEGSGKSTLIASLTSSLEEKGEPVLSTREPGAGALGAAIRSLLLDAEGMSPQTELFLFLADRANHCEEIVRPALADGKIVLCDRFADSTLVYQSLVRGLDESFVRHANRFATGGLEPDLTFLLDLPPEIGLARLSGKNRLDLEPLDFHRKVRDGFLRLANTDPGRWQVMDATRSQSEILVEVLSRIRPS